MEESLRKRLLTAAVLLSFLAGLLLLAAFSCVGKQAVVVAAVGLILLAAYELSQVVAFGGHGLIRRILYFVCAGSGCIGMSISAFSSGAVCQGLTSSELLAIPLIGFLVSLFIALTLITVAETGDIKNIPVMALELMLAAILIGFGGATLIALITSRDGLSILIWLIIVTSTNDSCAYFGGKQFGGPNLSVLVSPNKTWSGSFLGLCAGVLAAVIFSFLLPNVNLGVATGLGLAVGCAGQLGDLWKSAVKRVHGFKDFGSILPGHGGILDRIDAILAASIVTWIFVVIKVA